MHIAFDVKLVDLWDAKEKVHLAWEMFGGEGDQSGDGSKGVKPICNVHHTLLFIESFAGASLHRFINRTNVIDDVAVRDRDIRIGINAYDDGASSEWVAGCRVPHGAENIGGGASAKRRERRCISGWQ